MLQRAAALAVLRSDGRAAAEGERHRAVAVTCRGGGGGGDGGRMSAPHPRLLGQQTKVEMASHGETLDEAARPAARRQPPPSHSQSTDDVTRLQ